MYALHLRMNALDYVIELEVKFPNDDSNDVSFI
jgi:hypothetical protein